MSYFYMSNITNLDQSADKNKAYQEVKKCTQESVENGSGDGIINFTKDNINYSASFLMIRARYDNDLLIELSPSNYGVYIPANELWSVDSLENIDKIYIRNIFHPKTGKELDTGYIQWMIGYK